MLLITSVIYNLYKKSKQELTEEFGYIQTFQSKAEEIRHLKNKYSAYPIKLINRECKISDTDTKYLLECTFTQKNMYKVSNFLKSNVKLRSFSLKDSNGTVLFKAEIEK